MPSMLDAALKYAKEDYWPVFPCKRDKTPYVEFVVEATTDEAQIRKWWTRWPDANIGFIPGEVGLAVVDCDPGHNWEDLERNVGPVPVTDMVQKTPRGGFHEFFSLNPGEVMAPSVNKVADHFDIRSWHSYVLLAPSVTDDGTYTWESRGKPAQRTDEMLRCANIHAREKHEDRDTWIIEADMPENLAKYVSWLKNTARPAIKGQGGDQTAYATAAMGKSFGVSADVALDLMMEHWNPRCQPAAWTDERLGVCVEHAYGYNTSPPGNMTDAYRRAKVAADFKPVAIRTPEGDDLALTDGKFTIYDREQMTYIPAPKWIIPTLLQENCFAILFGSWGTGKSFLALDWALSIAVGSKPGGTRPWPDITLPGNVLYVAGEGQWSLEERIHAWEITHNGGEPIPRQRFHMLSPMPLVSETQDWERVTALAKQKCESYRLVVLDTASRAMAGVNASAQEHASKLTLMADHFKDALGCTILGVGHTGHGAQDRVAGSKEFANSADAMFSLERDGKDLEVTLTNLKQKGSPEWEKPMTIGLQEVTLSAGRTSLAAVTPMRTLDTETPTDGKKAKKHSRLDKDQDAVMELLDSLIRRALLTNNKRWPGTDLAVMVASYDECDIGSDRLRTFWLKRLREKKGTFSHSAFDPAAKTWATPTKGK